MAVMKNNVDVKINLKDANVISEFIKNEIEDKTRALKDLNLKKLNLIFEISFLEKKLDELKMVLSKFPNSESDSYNQ